jgi:DNA-binding MarR family transcriptional regulator
MKQEQTAIGQPQPLLGEPLPSRHLVANTLLLLQSAFERWSKASCASQVTNCDLSRQQLWLLRMLQNEDLSMASLARRLNVTPPVVTGLVDRLERPGYLQRVPDPVDRRRCHLIVTETGRAVSRSADDATQTFIAWQLDALPDDEISVLVKGIAVLNRFIAPSTTTECFAPER